MSLRSLGLPAVMLAAAFLSACASEVQTTSGKTYLQNYARPADTDTAVNLDREVWEAANVEPNLTFPARIGVARIEGGALSPIPEAEVEAWLGLAEELGPEWGQFVPISPLVVALASGPAKSLKDVSGNHQYAWSSAIERTIHGIRLGAARQHVDVVLIYEVGSTVSSASNPLSISKLVLVGFFVAPSEEIEGEAVAQAMLVDVRNGYTYGYASAKGDDFTLTIPVNVDEAKGSVGARAEIAAVLALVEEVETMARELRAELSEKRAAKTPAKAE